MELSMEIQGKGFDVLANIASDFPTLLPKQVVIVNNKVAKFHRKEIGKNIREIVNMKAKYVLEAITIDKIAEIGSTDAILVVNLEHRPSLKAFGARQTKSGVSYRIEKGGPRKKIKDGFGPNIQRLGKHVYKRKGKSRLPIAKLRGVSVAVIYGENNLIVLSEEQIKKRQTYEIERRIRALMVRAIRKNGRTKGLSTDQINQQLKSL